MKKAGRYVTAMIAAVMALNLAGFTSAEEVFTEETAIELPVEEITVEEPTLGRNCSFRTGRTDPGRSCSSRTGTAGSGRDCCTCGRK